MAKGWIWLSQSLGASGKTLVFHKPILQTVCQIEVPSYYLNTLSACSHLLLVQCLRTKNDIGHKLMADVTFQMSGLVWGKRCMKSVLDEWSMWLIKMKISCTYMYNCIYIYAVKGIFNKNCAWDWGGKAIGCIVCKASINLQPCLPSHKPIEGWPICRVLFYVGKGVQLFFKVLNHKTKA